MITSDPTTTLAAVGLATVSTAAGYCLAVTARVVVLAGRRWRMWRRWRTIVQRPLMPSWRPEVDA